MPENECSTFYVWNLMQRFPEFIFGKNEAKDYGIYDDDIDIDYTDKHNEHLHYSRKKPKRLLFSIFLVAHRCLQYTFNEGVHRTIKKNPDIDKEEAGELPFDKLEPWYTSEVIDRYQSVLAVYGHEERSLAQEDNSFSKRTTRQRG